MSKEKKQAACSAAKADKLPLWYPLAWSARGVSMSLNAIFVGYITFYCTAMMWKLDKLMPQIRADLETRKANG